MRLLCLILILESGKGIKHRFIGYNSSKWNGGGARQLRSLMTFFNRMNIMVWLVGIFVAHAALYLVLGTATWLATSLLATAFYGIILLVGKLIASRYPDKEESR